MWADPFPGAQSGGALVRSVDPQGVRRGSFARVAERETTIREFLAAGNEMPPPFRWTATLESMQEKLARCPPPLEQIQPGCTQPRSSKQKLSS